MQLARLAVTLPRLRNYTVQVQEVEDDVIFLHKITTGNADKSYGIHVARLAGVPESVLQRAEQVLASLEAPAEMRPPAVQLATIITPPIEDPTPKAKRTSKPTPIEVDPPEKPRRRVKETATSPNLFGETETHDTPF